MTNSFPKPVTRAIRHTICLLTLLFPAVVPVQAQQEAGEPIRQEDDEDRLRVGLVLGGGGARGAAHIGVIKELERQRVPIHAIVGTSMGAIVGGLYATGVSAEELENIVTTLDWADSLSDAPARNDLNFRRKQDDRQYPIHFEVGVRDSELLLPQGLIQGQKLDLLLRRFTMNAAEVGDFDELSIPFRAIASDLVKGEAHVMGEGDLSQVIRASMSVPGAFAPVEVDGRLLVDGGITGNLGVSVMREMGVDVIIAVDVEFPLYSRDELDSAITVSEQVLTILIRNETLRQIALLDDQDMLIQPDLGTFASTDFGDAQTAIEPGEAAARALAPRLARLAVDEKAYAAYQESRRPPPREPERLAFVKIEHDTRVAPEVLERRLDVEPGDTADPTRLEADANRLNGLQVFEKVGYRLVEQDGETGVVFSARRKSWGPGFVQFGLSLEDDFEGSTSFNLAARYWRPWVNSLGAEWRADLQLGTEPFLAAEFYQPVSTASPLFIAPSVTLGQRNFQGFQFQDPVARYRVSESEFRLDFGAELGRWGEARVGAFRGVGDVDVKVGAPTLPDFDFDSGGVLATFKLDTLDSAFFPTTGWRAASIYKLSRTSLGADSQYETLEFDVESAWGRGRNSLLLGLQYGTSLETVSAIQDYFPLGGFLRLSGLERGEISGPHYGLARLVYFRQVGDSATRLISVPIYIGASLEAGNAWQTRDDISSGDLLMNGSLYLAFDTYIGPAYIGVGLAESGGTNFYLFIGSSPR